MHPGCQPEASPARTPDLSGTPMWRRVLLLLSGCVAVLSLPLRAQGYQTQFSAVAAERSRGPETWHGVASVDAASGAVNIHMPLGPGIGARGATFQPAIRGVLKASMELGGGPVIQKLLDSQWVNLTGLPRAVPTSWGQATLGPGYLELQLLRSLGTTVWNGPEGQSVVFRPARPSGAAGMLLASVDPLLVASQFDGFEAGWRVATIGYRVGGSNLGTGGELLIALENSVSAPLLQGVPAQVDLGGQAVNLFDPYMEPGMLSLPPVLLVVKGDTAFEYRYQETIYQRVRDQSIAPYPLGDVASTLEIYHSTDPARIQPNLRAFRDYSDAFYDASGRLSAWNAYKANYRLVRILNRHREWIAFSYPDQGGWEASWIIDGSPTGVSISQDHWNNQTSELAYTGMGSPVAFRITPSTVGPPPILQCIQVRDAAGGMSFQEDATGNLAVPENLQRLLPAAVLNIPTGENVEFTYASAPGSLGFMPFLIPGTGYQWDPSILTRLTLPGRSIEFAWTSYQYRRNRFADSSPYQGYAQPPDLGYSGSGNSWVTVPWKASFAGVHKVTETELATGTQRITQHHRVIPDPSWSTPTGWTSTQFYDAIEHPDGAVVVHRFVRPLANGRSGGPSDSTPDEQMQTLAHLKHQTADIREYTPGADWRAELDATPGTGSAFRTTVFDRWDLRALGNPAGEFNVSSVPTPTRSRVWTKELPVVTQQEALGWDEQSLGWRVERKHWARSGSLPAGIEYRSLATQGLAPAACPTANQATLPAVRERVRTLSRSLMEWTFNRTDTTTTHHSDATSGRAVDSPSELVLPSQTTTWDPGVAFSRVQAQRIDTGGLQLSTQFQYKGSSGPLGSQLQSATTTGTVGATSPPRVGVATYSHDAFGYVAGLSPILPAGRVWTLLQANAGSGHPLSQTDANGLVTAYEWGPGGRLATITPAGREDRTLIVYDPDNLGLVITRGAQTSHLRYNAFGQLIREARRDGSGAWTHRLLGYDLAGRKTWESGWRATEGADSLWASPWAPGDVFSPSQGAWSEIWPATNGSLAKAGLSASYQATLHPAVPAGLDSQSTRYSYDGQGRLVAVQRPTGELTQLEPAVGGDGLLSRSTLAPGTLQASTSTQRRDELGRLISILDALGGRTEYRYDAADRLVRSTQSDPGTGTSQVRTWEYDGLGRLTALVQPESGRTEYRDFTLLGKPTRSTYGCGSGQERSLVATTDELDRVTSLVSLDGTVNRTFRYDEGGAAALANGKLSASTASGITKMFGYNGPGGLNGRLTSITYALEPGSPLALSLAYDSQGNVSARTYPDGRVQSLDHDQAMALPTAIRFGGAAIATLGYDAQSWNLTRISYASGASSSWTYDKDQARLKTLTHRIPGTAEGSTAWTYGYNEAGRLSTTGEDWYSYDALGRITSAFVRDPFSSLSSSDAGQPVLQTYGYDAYGNRTSLDSKAISNWPAGPPPPLAPITTLTSKAQSFRMSLPELANLARGNQLGATLGNILTGAHYTPQGYLDQIFPRPGATSEVISLGYYRATAKTDPLATELLTP